VEEMISGNEKSTDSSTDNSTVENSCGCTPQITYKPKETEDGEDIIEPYTCTIANEEKNQLMINAEVPGISKDDIDLELVGDDLILTAKNDQKYYRKTIHLDQEVSKRSIKANYNNGVLEITLKCKKPGQKKKGKKINIK
jgi:HSP20 family protein